MNFAPDASASLALLYLAFALTPASPPPPGARGWKTAIFSHRATAEELSQRRSGHRERPSSHRRQEDLRRR